ncbi:phage tail tip lysozyme [Caballeronia sordidicola]|uniref:Phage tail length tape-measure protein n=1 Tax=Caballeronia sordidicola TaxID=196367 RepID=A0A242N7V8_CABSO|nr:phage tail tip lysozyme [Caballeronia sordidicola]OTP79494.1 Phage tail length tape-measure protein [Caballeronia sordidicola]
MANNFQIVISAVNQASGPISQVQRSVRNLSQQVNGSRISNIGNMLTSAFQSPSGASSSIAKFLTGTNLAVGAIAALTIKFAELESQWASSGRAMTNLGIRTGLDTRTAYGVQIAGRLAGLTPEQANGGIEQVRQTYSDALNNRNPEALKRYQAAGISTDRTRMDSIETVLVKLSAYAEQLRKQGKYGGAQNFLGAAGASQLIDFLDRGPAQVASNLKTAGSYAPTNDDIRRANEYAEATAKLSITYDNLKNTLLSDVEPGLEKLLTGTQAFLDLINGRSTPETRAVRRGFEQFGNTLRGRGNQTMEEFARNGADPNAVRPLDPLERFGNFLRGNGGRTNAEVAAEPNANVPRALSYFESHGSSRDEAIGKTANLLRESSLDPYKEGDNGKAFGLAQWHADRQEEFKKWAGIPIQQSTFEQQLGFMDHELRSGNERPAGDALSQAQSAREAAEVVSRRFERPKDAEGEAALRGQIADRLAAIYGPQGSTAKGAVQANAPAVDADATSAARLAAVYSPPGSNQRAAPADQPEPIIAPAATSGTSDNGQSSGGAVGRSERMKIEIVHKNAPAGSSVNVSAPSSVDASLTTDRQQSSLGEQYAYSPRPF